MLAILYRPLCVKEPVGLHKLSIRMVQYSLTEDGLILGLRPANERLCYFVTTSPIGWVQAQNQPWWHSNTELGRLVELGSLVTSHS